MRLTHVAAASPNRTGWTQVAFLTKHEGEYGFFLGFGYAKQGRVGPEAVQEAVARKEYVSLATPTPIDTSKCVWVAPDGLVYLADSLHPEEDGGKVQLQLSGAS